MFSRSVVRAASQASRAARVSRVSAAPSVARIARANFSVGQKKDYEPITEKEIPRSTYEPGSTVQRTTINVEESAKHPAADTQEVFADKVVPLSRASFEKMTPMMQKMTLMDKVVIVTGGARGLGNNMARACIEAGAKAIIVFDANQELGDVSCAELHDLTGKSVPIEFAKIDVRDGGAVEEAVKAVVEKYGAPDVLINSAGIADSNIPAETYDHAMFRRLIDINLNGSFMVAQAVGKAMIEAGKPGSIILVASMSGSIVNYPQEQSCYNASKAGVIQLGKSLAAEWAKYNIRVNCISPGYMDTALNNVPALDAQKVIWKSLTPQNRLGAVDDLNGLAVFLGSDSSAFMTGSNVLIDGGYTLY